MFGLTISVFFVIVMCVYAQRGYRNPYLVMDDANKASSIPIDWDVEDPSIITFIDVRNVNVDKINTGAFENFTSLEELLLTGRVTSIEDYAFTGLDKLKRLTLNGAGIQYIGPKVFHNLNSLKWLDLASNEIKEIHLTNLTLLMELNLSHNKITFLEEDTLMQLPELTDIRLDHNLITRVDKNYFINTPKLGILDLGFNLIKELNFPDKLEKLSYVYLQHNQIQSIELSAATQRNIEVLHLGDNNLTHLNESFQHLINLQTLSLNKNKIKNFPLCIPGSLTDLDLSQNKLHEITLDKLCGSATQGKLQTVSLFHNEIIELNNNSFRNLPELIYVAIDNNKIRSIEFGTFSGCSKLIELSLYNNQLADFEPDSFRDLHKLEVLILRNNNLKTITSNHFKGLTSLKHLDLSLNNITSLDPFLLNNLIELTDVWFNHNSITSLPESFYNSTPKLELIDLGFNLLKEFHLSDKLEKLSNVYLQDNELESIKLPARTQRNIKRLELSDNNLTHLNESFQHLINLRELSLRNNKFKSFPLCIPDNLIDLDLSQNELHEIALDKFCGSATQGKLQSINLSSNRFTSYNLTHSNRSLQETQPDLNDIDLSINLLNADSVKLMKTSKLRHVKFLKIEPQQKVMVKIIHNESMNGDGNTTWIVVTSAALAVIGVFAVIGAILFVCKQRRRTNPNVNDAVMLNELYDDIGPSPFYHYPRFPIYDSLGRPHIYHYPRFRPHYDEVRPQPVYLSVLPDIPGPQPLEQEDIEPEENLYEEID